MLMPLLEHLQLALTPGLGPITIARLIEALGSAERATQANAVELQRIDGVGSIKAQAIVSSRRAAQEQAKREIERAAELGFTILSRDDPTYPPMLAAINDAPVVLYVKGTLEPRDLHAVSIVGSRKCSLYGREQSERFAALLAGAGVTIISGGARGIDSAAHRGALQHPQGRTIAVLGCGLDICYPPENAALFDQIAQRGAVVSEYPLGTPPAPENFPRRNRIISGLCRAVLVIEADVRSGALITARLAADDQNRPVLAVPGRLDNPLSAGPHKLIRDGATLATCLEDILESLGPMPDAVSEPSQTIAPKILPETPTTIPPSAIFLSESQRLVLEHLTAEPTHVDRLIELTQLSPGQVLPDLTLLTLRGLAKRHDGQHYIKARST
ncbi:MAG TPA: DNA-processing protein DprA [Tepidisphaeraceae bacterium]|jgi:DNA processing protein